MKKKKIAYVRSMPYLKVKTKKRQVGEYKLIL